MKTRSGQAELKELEEQAVLEEEKELEEQEERKKPCRIANTRTSSS